MLHRTDADADADADDSMNACTFMSCQEQGVCCTQRVFKEAAAVVLQSTTIHFLLNQRFEWLASM